MIMGSVPCGVHISRYHIPHVSRWSMFFFIFINFHPPSKRNILLTYSIKKAWPFGMLRHLQRSFSVLLHNTEELSHALQEACLHPSTKAHVRRHWPLRSAAQRMIPALSPVALSNPLGFATKQQRKPGTLLDFVSSEKEKHPDKVVLCRVGEFFEAFGVDALLLVEHCGLNAMGLKSRAGCPRSNVQQTLDGLTNAGLTVAVYEEAQSGALTTAGLKRRYLAQVVSPSTPTFFHNSTLRLPDVEFRESAPFIGLQISSRGSTTSSSVDDTIHGSRAEGSLHYTVYEVNVESLTIRVNERMTEDSAKCVLEATSCVGLGGEEGVAGGNGGSERSRTGSSVYYAGPPTGGSGGGGSGGASSLSLLSARTRRMLGGTNTNVVRLKTAEIDSRTFLIEMLRSIATDVELPHLGEISSYRMLSSGYKPDKEENNEKETFSKLSRLRPRPLYSPTAQQLGLLPSPQVPDLVRHLLPRGDAPSASRNFLRRWMLRPPPPLHADNMRALLSALESIKKIGIPTVRTTLSTRKLVALCTSKSANAAMFRDLHQVLSTTSMSLSRSEQQEQHSTTKSMNREEDVMTPLVALVGYECGVEMTSSRMLEEMQRALRMVESVVVLDADWFDTWLNAASAEELWAGGEMVTSMITKNEVEYRSAVKKEACLKVMSRYDEVDQTRRRMVTAIRSEYGDQESMLKKYLKYDVINNTIYLTGRGKKEEEEEEEEEEDNKDNEDKEDKEDKEEKKVWIRPRDRNGKALHNRWTTTIVEECVAEYVDACEKAKEAVRATLRDTCSRFVTERYLESSICSVTMNEILLTANLHVREYTRRKWLLPHLESTEENEKEKEKGVGQEEDNAIRVSLFDLFPYWLDQTNSVTNNVDLCGQWIVTGPNMAGKSTLLRSVTAASLLANCGMACPARTELTRPMPRLDGYFLRTNGSDCPAEGLSAFALEADDIRILMRDVTSRSLAAVSSFFSFFSFFLFFLFSPPLIS